MARQTSTRQRVRDLAAELAQGGVEPTPTEVRRRLGAGSFSTIVSELKALKASPALQERSAPATLPRAPARLQAPSSTVEAAEPAMEAPPLLSKAQEELFQQVREGLAALATRLDGMQRHHLLQVNEAREQAATWKSRYLSAKQEFSVWRDSLQAQNLRLVEELAWLRGQKGLPLPRGEQVAAPSPHPPARYVVGSYPGHPRAAYGADEADGPAE